MKKIIIASISSLTLLALAACDGGEGGGTAAPDSGAQTDTMDTAPATEPTTTPPAQ